MPGSPVDDEHRTRLHLCRYVLYLLAFTGFVIKFVGPGNDSGCPVFVSEVRERPYCRDHEGDPGAFDAD